MKLCECGCGNQAPIASKTNKSRGWIKGMPLRFIVGHSGRMRESGIISYRVDSETGCWIWKRSLQTHGYGHLTINNKQILAHVYVYEQLIGPVPKGKEFDHKCRNTSCVNPAHLEPVTHAENCRRGLRAKINHSVAKKIRERFNRNPNISQLARSFNLDRKTVRDVVKERSWA